MISLFCGVWGDAYVVRPYVNRNLEYKLFSSRVVYASVKHMRAAIYCYVFFQILGSTGFAGLMKNGCYLLYFGIW